MPRLKAVIYSHVLAYYTYQTYVIRIQLVVLCGILVMITKSKGGTRRTRIFE